MEQAVAAALVCQEACGTDADCADGTVCGEAGRCIPCNTDGDCDSGTCVEGACVECTSNDDCAGNENGTRCSAGGTCICATDDECEAPMGLCRATGCVCGEDAGCAGIGPEICSFGACVTCDDDSHCADGPSKCFAGGSPSSFCGCAADSECPAGAPFCDTETGSCLTCKADSDCVDAQLGDTCDGGSCTCTAASQCGGATSNPGAEWVCE